MTAFPIRYYCGNRLFEWAMTFAMLGLAIEITIWPATIGSSAFRYMLFVVSTPFLGWFFLLAGTVRIAALISNGNWPVYGPCLRSLTAGATAIIWMQMDAALFMLVGINDAPSPGIPVYFALTIGELFSCYRALSDARPRGN
jgi:hypothetical protein